MTDALVVLLVVLPPFDWLAAVILSRLSRQHPGIVSLRERALSAVMFACVASVAGILGWVRLGFVHIGGDVAVLLLAAALVIASGPALLWLGLLLTGRFRDGGPA